MTPLDITCTRPYNDIVMTAFPHPSRRAIAGAFPMIADNAKAVMALRSIQNHSGLRKTDGDIWTSNNSWGNPWIYVWKNENGRGRIVQLPPTH